MKRLVFPGIIALVLLVQFEGCTVVGGVVGAVIDHNQPSDTVWMSSTGALNRSELNSLTAPVSTQQTSVIGMEPPAKLAGPDTVTHTGSVKMSGDSAGHGIDSKFLATLNTPAPGEVQRTNFLKEKDLRTNVGDPLSNKSADTTMTHSTMPLRSAIRPSQESTPNSTSVPQMQFELKPRSHNHYLYGMLVGLGLDIISYAIIASTLSGGGI